MNSRIVVPPAVLTSLKLVLMIILYGLTKKEMTRDDGGLRAA